MGPIAQSVEQRTFNPWVDGSSPSGPTHIGSDVWICYGVRILSGVSIGHGAVIGAGSLISEVRLHFLLSLGIRQNSFGCDLPLLKSSNY